MVIQGNQRRILPERGFPVGMFEWASFESYTMDVSKPFILAMFSDGVLECLREKGINFEEKALLDLHLDESDSPVDIIEQLQVKDFDKLPDDVTIFILQRKP